MDIWLSGSHLTASHPQPLAQTIDVKTRIESFMESLGEISGYLGDAYSRVKSIVDGSDSSDSDDVMEEAPRPKTTNKVASSSKGFKPQNASRFKYIPLRLSEEERKLLAVLENALEVCEYTDVVDVTFSHTRKSKMSRIMESLIDVLSISCGLIVSNALCLAN